MLYPFSVDPARSSPRDTRGRNGTLMISELITKSSDHSTGPRTPEGKAVSSLNATTHGLCSNTIVLPGESQAEWEALRAIWISEYGHPNLVVISLAEQTARAEWFFNRATKRYNEVEQALYLEQPDPVLWTDEQHKRLERFQRYRTTHERSFQRTLNMLNRAETLYLKAAADLVKNAAMLAQAKKVREEFELQEKNGDFLPKADRPVPVTSHAQREPDVPLLPQQIE